MSAQFIFFRRCPSSTTMYLQAGVSKRIGAGSHEQGIKEYEEHNIAQARREPKKKRKWKGNEKEKNPPHDHGILPGP
jgi:hypothetical protein